MKYIKTFENLEEPEIGDYVLMQLRHTIDYSPEYVEFIKNNVGEIVSKNDNRIEVRYYVNTFEEFVKIENNFRYISYDSEQNEYYFSNMFSSRSVLEIGKTKEDVELKASTKKYNL